MLGVPPPPGSASEWFLPYNQVSSTNSNKTDREDIAKLLLKHHSPIALC